MNVQLQKTGVQYLKRPHVCETKLQVFAVA
jgi:hypothetical protein